MFKTIELRNFRSFSSLTLDLTGPRDVPLDYAVVYGRNASGKTSLMRSVDFLRASAMTLEALSGLILDPVTDSSHVGRVMADMARSRRVSLADLVEENMMESPDGPMLLSYRFSVGGSDASYRLEFDPSGAMVSEVIKSVSPKGRLTEYMRAEREGDDVRFRINSSVIASRDVRSWIEEQVRQYWGKHTMLAIVVFGTLSRNRRYMEDAAPGLVALVDYVTGLNSGMTGIGGDAEATIESDLGHGWIESDDMWKLEAYRAAASRFFTRVDPDVEDVHYRLSQASEYHVEYTLYFRRCISGRTRDIRYSAESSGVRKLLRLLPMLMGCAEGRVSFVDEMDTGIHDKLMHDLFLQMLPDMKGQLVVTTHNTSLLQELDPHNVFILDVDLEGNRTVSRVSAIARTRESNNNRDRYMRGDLGGVPHLATVDMGNIVRHLKEDLGR